MKPIPTPNEQPDEARIVVNAFMEANEYRRPHVAIDLRERFRSGIDRDRRDSPQHRSKN